MATRKCSKCGWEVSYKSVHQTCPICGTRYKVGACSICGTTVQNLVSGKYCVKCFREKYNVSKTTQDWRKRKRRENDEALEKWLGKISLLPSDYPTLTQQQWLKTCSHFGGCAFCESKSIDTRAYFIPFKLGGRYCDWNIVPACEACATRIKLMDNPFVYLERRSERDKLLGVIQYLEEILDAEVGKLT